MNPAPVSNNDDLSAVLSADADGTTRHALVQYLTGRSRECASSADAAHEDARQAYVLAADIVERLSKQ